MGYKNIQRLRENTDILGYAKYLGFTPVKAGRYWSLKEHDSIRIDTEKNRFYRNSNGDHGGVIDLALSLTGMPMGQVIQSLETYVDGADKPKKWINKSAEKYVQPDEPEAAHLQLPPKDSTYKNIFAYLIKTRGISSDIVNWMVKNHYLYQDQHKNCVFVSYDLDGNPVFANKRGTNTYKRFVADVKGSDYSHGCLYRNGSNTLIVTESVIDCMSIMTLAGDFHDYDYLSLSGVSKLEPVFNHLSRGRYNKLILAFDNDEAGHHAVDKIAERLQSIGTEIECEVRLPEKKDWNEQLMSAI